MRLAVFFVCALIASTAFSNGADVSVVDWRGHRVILVSGQIEPGDTAKIDQVLSKADVMPYGTPVVLLDGPGGSVGEALKVSALFDRSPVHTVIRNGAFCASACGSILFVAGKYRTLEEGAILGQHSCSMNGTPDTDCNEIISMHAFRHGVSHGAIAAFINHTSPQDIMWFSREDAEAWGLTRYPGEDMSGFEKSEPRFVQSLTGTLPPAQAKWRLGFREKGFDAFVRVVSDFDREMQISFFCWGDDPGRTFVAIEIVGNESEVKNAVIGAKFQTDATEDITNNAPIIYQKDGVVTEIVLELPRSVSLDLINKAQRVKFELEVRQPYTPIIARTRLEDSRAVLRLAAGNCG